MECLDDAMIGIALEDRIDACSINSVIPAALSRNWRDLCPSLGQIWKPGVVGLAFLLFLFFMVDNDRYNK